MKNELRYVKKHSWRYEYDYKSGLIKIMIFYFLCRGWPANK